MRSCSRRLATVNSHLLASHIRKADVGKCARLANQTDLQVLGRPADGIEWRGRGENRKNLLPPFFFRTYNIVVNLDDETN
jgi:hypothetical protein